jgi:LacI family transcriptional regulator
MRQERIEGYKQACHEAGLALDEQLVQVVPGGSLAISGRLALMTFDDDLWLSTTTPRISAVAQPAESIGFAAAKQLLKRIRAKAWAYKTLRLDAELIFRESCQEKSRL